MNPSGNTAQRRILGKMWIPGADWLLPESLGTRTKPVVSAPTKINHSHYFIVILI